MSIFFFFLAVLLSFVSRQLGNLTPINDGCVCPGGVLRLNCTTVGDGITIWKGTAFPQVGCNRDISLIHSEFMGLITRNESRFCPNSVPAINATPISIVGDSFTSQLTVLRNRADLNGSTIVCQYEITTTIDIGTYTIMYTTGEKEGEKERERERQEEKERERQGEKERRREREIGREGERDEEREGEGEGEKEGEREAYFCLRFIETFPSSN